MTKRMVLILAVVTVAALAVTACSHTMHGVGRDIENTGQTIQDAF